MRQIILLILAAYLLTACGTVVDPGPASIEFGCAIDESGATVLLKDRATHFPDGTPGGNIAWLTSLGRPVGSTKPEIVLSMSTGAAGGEVVIASNPIQLASPDFTVVYGTLSPALYFTPGIYKLRLVSGDTILAEGQFEVP